MLEILYLNELDSTQEELLAGLKSKKYRAPIAICAKIQRKGRGSRDNRWESIEGNLFFSFALKKSALPKDIKLESLSIYFAYIMKSTLQKLGSNLWIKWPNDFYLKEKKIGGVITNISGENIVCGVGINTQNAPDFSAILDIDTAKSQILQSYFENLEEKKSWKQIFSKFKVEFELSRAYQTHFQDEIVDLKEAKLLEDGSLEYRGKKVYSLR